MLKTALILSISITFLSITKPVEIEHSRAKVQYQEIDSSSIDSMLYIEGVYIFEKHEYINYKHLRNDYGLFVTDHPYDKTNGTIFELLYKKERKIFKTNNLTALEMELKKIPIESIVDWFDTCTFSKMMSFTKTQKKDLVSIFKNLKIQLNEPGTPANSNIVCYCQM